MKYSAAICTSQQQCVLLRLVHHNCAAVYTLHGLSRSVTAHHTTASIAICIGSCHSNSCLLQACYRLCSIQCALCAMRANTAATPATTLQRLLVLVTLFKNRLQQMQRHIPASASSNFQACCSLQFARCNKCEQDTPQRGRHCPTSISRPWSHTLHACTPKALLHA